MRHYFQDVKAFLAKYQDNGFLSNKDIYGQFILQVIGNNTNTNIDSDDFATVDIEGVKSDVQYMKDQLDAVLKGIAEINLK